MQSVLGEKQIEPIKNIASLAMRIALILTLILFVVISLFPHQVLMLFTTDELIIAEGVKYLAIIRFTYLFFTITQILLATLRSIGVVQIAFRLSVQTLIINCIINYILIYGHFGAPEMGTIGAAIGTLVARISETIVVIIYIIRKEKHLNIHVKDYLKIDRTLSKDYVQVTLPMIVTRGLWGLNTAMQTVILGHMTSAAIAANSAASTVFLLVKSLPQSTASTASILIGKSIGQGDLKKVKILSKNLQKLSLVIGICAGMILYFVRIPILGIYDLTPETKEMTNTFLIILSVITPVMSYHVATNSGIIQGGGDTKYVLRMDLISSWGIVIPLSLVMAFIVEASPTIVVCCLNSDQVFKCIPAFIKANYGHWAHKLTREN